MRFVGAARPPAGQAYEAFSDATRCIPMRDNLLELFSFDWLALPRAKG